jgi:hypothetical protein
MKIISLAGQMQMGKDTVADYLATKLKGWKRVAWAAQVKKVFCDAFAVDLDFIEKWKTQAEPPEGFLKNVRKSLQFIGDGFREIQSNIWVELCLRHNEPPFIVSDTRYINELQKVRDLGGFNILVYRPGKENDDPNGSEAQIKPVLEFFSNMKCFSETPGDTGRPFEGLTSVLFSNLTAGDRAALPPGAGLIDFFIRNEGTKEDLYAKIDNHLVDYLKNWYG